MNLPSEPAAGFDIALFFPDGIDAVGDSGMAGFEEKRPLYLSGSKAYLARYRSEIRKMHEDGASGTEVTHAICRMMDALVERLFLCVAMDIDPSIPEHVTLAAVGGYGRGELNPFSDIDIMFLHDGIPSLGNVEDLAQKVLYFLWDMRLEVGYSVRTVSDCEEMSAQDTTVRTALMDSRRISGCTRLFEEFSKCLFTRILPRSSDKFIQEKIDEMKKRREKFGASIYILEPNIKEGEGGLRDLQTAMWVARGKYKFSDSRELVIKGILTEEEHEAYRRSLDFLWRIRNQLHFQCGRKNDQLTFDAQNGVASFLGYSDRGKVLAVEDFMRDYYRHAARVEHLVAVITARCIRKDEGSFKILGYFVRRQIEEGCFVLKGELTVPDTSVVRKKPELLMKVFELAQKHGVRLNISVKSMIRFSLSLVDEDFRNDPEVGRSFLAILRSPKGVAETLRVMHHLEFLNNYLPELENIYCKVQHDLYHIYTVDIHTLFAVEEAEKILNGTARDILPFPCEVAEGIGKRELFILAVLLHDVGKGEGGGHAEKGAAMVPAIARRLGLNSEDSSRLEFLVRQHLLFAHIAQRRDLNDEKMIIQFARQMETSENLKMLYLLTVADVRAVGSDVWTNWKAALFQELYEKAFNVLERGGFKLEERSERINGVIASVVRLLDGEFDASAIAGELKALPTRYLLSNPPEAISSHVRLLAALAEHSVATEVSHEPDSGFSFFTICAYDTPGFFSKITGVMASHGINILGAQINTAKNGKVLDILQVNSTQGLPVTDEGRWARIREDMVRVLHDEVPVAELVEKRQRPSPLMTRPAPRFPTRVDIDLDVSDEYTVIDVYTHDKVGLLYLITSTLTALGLYIGVSKVSTKVDQVADVFYVKDIFGHKVTKEEKLAEVRTRLVSAIDSWT